eukprot:CAMPEP_0197290864 /NCGR_PEP_ID=MMETSP0890-20130614/10277_1 /TAXON_ID=44058 ORGANISM="Aureoumbra lagunensis, Strain CCMP1510" /NCGR_SAMPLE_ID=MMETSP0890 /ASSEMBLY_ACC=CAM_ASM_000533 /LENGTH=266 /DNA_ID=CAMNT_0042763219 /DNA_START=78 /DNA_END=878 /DNA_ORIENTATION=-
MTKAREILILMSIVYGQIDALNGDHVLKATRRTLIGGLVAQHLLAPVFAAEEELDVYFGVGCFWHVQHEMAMAEKNILGRSDMELTATAGYAGGLSTGKDPSRPGKSLVCYHNLQRIADYGSLGHAEAVRVKVPASTVPEFTKEYAKLFDKQGDRPDKGDRGLEYRSVIGLPGGQSSPFYNQVKEILQDAKGLNLMTGKGNDPDTLGKKNVWLYDTNSFPLYQAEVYHQMHDGFFPGENYPSEYNALNKKLFEAGRFVDTGCPDII